MCSNDFSSKGALEIYLPVNDARSPLYILQLNDSVFKQQKLSLSRIAGGIYLSDQAPGAALRSLCWDLLKVEKTLPRSAGEPLHELAESLSTDKSSWAVAPLSRGLTQQAKILRGLLGASSGSEPERCLVLGAQTAWVTRPELPWLEDRFNRAAQKRVRHRQVSRAEVKWLQTRPLLASLGLSPDAPERWLELGAAPGGITLQLSNHAHVTAIDLGELAPQVREHPRVHAISADIHAWRPEKSQRFDGLLCDLNGSVRSALRGVVTHAVRLTPNAPVVVTLKLEGWGALEEVLLQARRRFKEVGLKVLRHQHLSSHRSHEVVLIAQREGPSTSS